MKACLPCCVFVALLLAAAGSNAQTTAAKDGYKLVWSDEFSHDPDGLPDATKWSYEEGFVRNNEAQYYTKARLENARVEHGELIIEARKESFPWPLPNGPQTANYTSASLHTLGKAEWKYGRLEVRAKLPNTKGTWPAIWTLGTNMDKVGWPRCGEIDIMELIGREPHTIYGTVHYFVGGKDASNGAQLPIANPGDYHVYKTEWTPDHIDLFVDGKRYVNFEIAKAANDGSNPFRLPHYLILNLALGGNWGGAIDDASLPQRMVIDYVRVYQKPSPP